MGFTYDSLPLVGKLPSSLTGRNLPPKSLGSEWMAAGFNGEGMVHAWRSGIAVAQMLLEHIDPMKIYGLMDGKNSFRNSCWSQSSGLETPSRMVNR